MRWPGAFPFPPWPFDRNPKGNKKKNRCRRRQSKRSHIHPSRHTATHRTHARTHTHIERTLQSQRPDRILSPAQPIRPVRPLLLVLLSSSPPPSPPPWRPQSRRVQTTVPSCCRNSSRVRYAAHTRDGGGCAESLTPATQPPHASHSALFPSVVTAACRADQESGRRIQRRTQG